GGRSSTMRAACNEGTTGHRPASPRCNQQVGPLVGSAGTSAAPAVSKVHRSLGTPPTMYIPVAMLSTGAICPVTMIGPRRNRLVVELSEISVPAAMATVHLPSAVVPVAALTPILWAICARVQFAAAFASAAALVAPEFCWAQACAAVRALPASALPSASRASRT